MVSVEFEIKKVQGFKISLLRLKLRFFSSKWPKYRSFHNKHVDVQ